MKAIQSPTTIDFLRHGECQGGNIYRGTTDVQLTETGWQQMQRALSSEIDVGKNVPWQKIISSPLQRCRIFSASQGKKLDLPVAIESRFREMDFGKWEGRTIQEVWKNDRDAVDSFYRYPDRVSPPSGESMSALLERLIAAWDNLLKNHRGEHLLVVLHGGTIRVLFSWLLQMPLRAATQLDIPYASFSRFQVFFQGEESFSRLVFLNK